MKFDDKGRELPDSTPIELPLHWQRPQTIQEQIRSFVRSELSRRAAAQGEETFEEADDFDVDDDFDPRSPWELNFDQEQEPRQTAEPPAPAPPPPPPPDPDKAAPTPT